ncbi:thiol reductant ABC exporter subunit CydC [Pseudogemmobacter sonorensis]|uniref:thiol reductant ABC exporter subunit CydC n=1 Tax=Pseudogemmobacter sonorensis TaxID=2989681 RepID=UPI00367CF996
MKRLIYDMRPILALFASEGRRRLWSGAALAAVTMLAGMALLGLSGWFITATAIAGLSVATALAFDVFMPSAGIRLLALGRTAARYGERLVTHDATLAVLASLRERLFRGWSAAGAAGALSLRPSRLLFRLTVDIDALDTLYLRVLVPLGAALASAAAAGIVLGLMDPLFGLAAFGILIAAGLGIPIAAGRAARVAVLRRARATEALRDRTIDLVRGQTELVMAGRLNAQRAAIAAADARLAAADDRLNRIETWAGFSLGATSAALLAGGLIVVGALTETGRISTPVAALALLVILAAMDPFGALRRGAMDLPRSRISARRLSPRLGPLPEVPARPLPDPGHAARLQAVSLRHPGAARPVLREVTLDIAGGEHVALIGASGAGKSSLLALLAGEIEAESGSVACRPASLMTQRTELFQDSLRDNLRLAAPMADDARLLAALEAAGLGPEISALAEGLDTRLGEGGMGLSGGQARRLALARLILRDAPLWLLDEPTEGLDGATAREVIARLRPCIRGRAVVIATHIRREAALADRILHIDGGRIVADHPRGSAGWNAALEHLRPD